MTIRNALQESLLNITMPRNDWTICPVRNPDRSGLDGTAPPLFQELGPYVYDVSQASASASQSLVRMLMSAVTRACSTCGDMYASVSRHACILNKVSHEAGICISGFWRGAG